MPGECLSIYTKGNPEKGAEIVFQYVTHNDADLIHFDRFLIDDLVSEGFMIATSVHPGWRARRRLRYRGKDLFLPFGLSRIRRVLRLNATSRHQAALIREATDWLSREGYEAYSIGAYANDEG